MPRGTSKCAWISWMFGAGRVDSVFLRKKLCINFRLRGCHTPPYLRLDGKTLPYVDSVRFLRLIYDHRLNWREHLKFLKDKCFKILNMIRILSNTSWGADRSTLLLLYRALVRSRLDYGSMVYSSGRESYLRPISAVHNAGLRLAIGAYRTSPVVSIYSDVGEPPLAIRRNILTCNYLVKILSMMSHPCYDVIFNPRFLDLFYSETRATRPLRIRFREFLTKNSFNLPQVYTVGHPSAPPWTLERVEFNLI